MCRRTVFTEQDLFGLIGIDHDADDDVHLLGEVRRRFVGRAAFFGKSLRSFKTHIAYADMVACTTQ